MICDLFISNLLHQSMSRHVVQFWCCYIVVVTVWCCYMRTCRLYVEEKGQPDDQIATVLLSEESISESAYQPFLYSNCFQFILLILQTIWKQTDSHYNNYFTIGRLEDVFMNPVCPQKKHIKISNRSSHLILYPDLLPSSTTRSLQFNQSF